MIGHLSFLIGHVLELENPRYGCGRDAAFPLEVATKSREALTKLLVFKILHAQGLILKNLPAQPTTKSFILKILI